MARDVLSMNGVHAEIIGAKDYVTHYAGGFFGRYELVVPENEAEAARDILARYTGPRLVSNDDEGK